MSADAGKEWNDRRLAKWRALTPVERDHARFVTKTAPLGVSMLPETTVYATEAEKMGFPLKGMTLKIDGEPLLVKAIHTETYMDDQQWMAHIKTITDPVELWREMIKLDTNVNGIGDPYYRDLYSAILTRAEELVGAPK